MTERPNRILSGGIVALFGVLSLTGCGDGGALGALDRLGREDQSPTTTETSGTSVKATVARVVDGDTVTVKTTGGLPANNASGREHSVRVLGIDAPEMDWELGNHECGAEEASERAKELIREGDAVTLVYDEGADRFDRYSRSLAYVEIASGEDLGATLVKEGLVAAWYPSSAPEPARYAGYAEAQDQAESSGLGAWAECDSMGR